MSSKAPNLAALVLVSTLGLPASGRDARAQEPGGVRAPIVPKTWDDAAIASLEVPLVEPKFAPVHIKADYYYRIPVRPIYKSYPIYAPGETHKIVGEEF